jgi:hypothetical protein
MKAGGNARKRKLFLAAVFLRQFSFWSVNAGRDQRLKTFLRGHFSDPPQYALVQLQQFLRGENRAVCFRLVCLCIHFVWWRFPEEPSHRTKYVPLWPEVNPAFQAIRQRPAGRAKPSPLSRLEGVVQPNGWGMMVLTMSTFTKSSVNVPPDPKRLMVSA